MRMVKCRLDGKWEISAGRIRYAAKEVSAITLSVTRKSIIIRMRISTMECILTRSLFGLELVCPDAKPPDKPRAGKSRTVACQRPCLHLADDCLVHLYPVPLGDQPVGTSYRAFGWDFCQPHSGRHGAVVPGNAHHLAAGGVLCPRHDADHFHGTRRVRRHAVQARFQRAGAKLVDDPRYLFRMRMDRYCWTKSWCS